MSSIITLCRFDASGNLILQTADILSTEYIAISHVWREVSWTTIPGVPFKILLSPQKARFIENRLPSLVGTVPFWMDVLTIDQSKDEERMKLVGHIPAIYGKAMKTIIVREDGGFGHCCLEFAVALIPKYTYKNGVQRVVQQTLDDFNFPLTDFNLHLKKHHPRGINEIWLTRLWPLQEVLLSSSVAFVTCEKTEESGQRYPRGELSTKDILRQFFDLQGLSEAWAGGNNEYIRGKPNDTFESLYDRALDQLKSLNESAADFLRAFFSNGTTTRECRNSEDHEVAIMGNLKFMYESRMSFRETGKARDFILAMLPKFDWYQLPSDARLLGFGELWADAATQINHHYTTLGSWEQVIAKPLITQGVLNNFHTKLEEAWKPAIDIPTPRTLGEYTLLFFLDKEKIERIWPENYVHGSKWRIVDRSWLTVSMDEILGIIFDTFKITHEDAQGSFLLQSDRPQAVDARISPRVGLASQGLEEGLEPATNVTETGWALFDEEHMLDPRVGPAAFLERIWRISERLYQFCSRKWTPGNKDAYAPCIEWQRIKEDAKQADSPSFRMSLLQLASLMAADLGMYSFSWSNGKLKPYQLSYHPEGDITKEPTCRMLVLAAPDLEIHDSDEIEAFVEAIPHLIVRSARDSMKRRVVGLTPTLRLYVENEDCLEQGIVTRVNGYPFAWRGVPGSATQAQIDQKFQKQFLGAILGVEFRGFPDLRAISCFVNDMSEWICQRMGRV